MASFLLLVTSSLGAASTEQGLSSSSSAEQYLLAAANQERAARGLSSLQRNPALAEAAAFHAREMAQHEDISHQFSGEPTLEDRSATAGAKFSLISENVAEAPDFAEIHVMWMNSPGHRANLLDQDVNAVGIAVISWDGEFYAVEDFASTVEALSFPQQEAAVSSLIASSGIRAGASQSARETCSMATGYAGTRRPWFVMRYTASRLDQLPKELESRLNTGKYHNAVVGACTTGDTEAFTAYNVAVLLYP